MTDSQPREDRHTKRGINTPINNKICKKNADFFCIYQKLLLPLQPNLRRSRVKRRKVVGSLHIEKAFIDALYLTHKKLSTLFQLIQSQKQSKQLRLRV